MTDRNIKTARSRVMWSMMLFRAVYQLHGDSFFNF